MKLKLLALAVVVSVGVSIVLFVIGDHNDAILWLLFSMINGNQLEIEELKVR